MKTGDHYRLQVKDWLKMGMRINCKNSNYLFGKYFLPISILLIIIMSVIYYIDNKSRTSLLHNREYLNILQQEKITKHEIEHIIGDLKVLSHHSAFKQYDLENKLDVKAIQYDFLQFSTEKPNYDQIRFISADGMEKVRVNRKDSNPFIVADSHLQNKANRYYFSDTMELDKGNVYFSPLDLNIEQGVIEEPINPMLRVATPVFNNTGLKIGIVIINVKARHLLNRLLLLDNISTGVTLLINSDSYFLKGFNSNDEWGFMYPEKNDLKFSKQFPSAWKTISTTNRGQFITDEGLFTFVTIHPLPEIIHSSTGASGAFESSSKKFLANEYYWFLISYVTPLNYNYRIWIFYLLGTIFLLFIVGLYAWKNAQIECKRISAEKALEQEATHDTLTQLPNRKLLYQRLDYIIENAKRKERKFALLFIDLDKFKMINDTYGHKAGDTVLVTTSFRIKSILRRSDTVARIGGDEFIVLLPELEQTESPEIVAKKLIDIINKRILIKYEHNVIEQYVGTSIGISIYPNDGGSSDVLIHKADQAMYNAKNRGRNQFCSYVDDAIL
ncbi:hypothetical protein CSW98_14120 [Vibrio sp. HA2012]|uniref:diguanylate cyclase domain-containing protein n=1 Tax=Vibrio sp. HA2012 TaxID=1971595 RepID=UPI000C2BD99F|nr:diguanylate cyclase [Vibrio sp. HA2012]PJC85709.1 hypothetical protein CSW98_14120 [Vibrio sp. HA2012]